MKLRKKRIPKRLVVRGHQAPRADEIEYEDYYPEIMMVGSAISDWGPADEPHRWPWQKKEEKTKRAFGFARALED